MCVAVRLPGLERGTQGIRDNEWGRRQRGGLLIRKCDATKRCFVETYYKPVNHLKQSLELSRSVLI